MNMNTIFNLEAA